MALPGSAAAAPVAAADQFRDDLLSALVNLGYQRAAAERAIDKSVKPDAGFEQALRDVLRALMGSR